MELLRQGYNALNDGDLDELMATLDPDIEFDLSRRTFDSAIYRGHEGVRENLALMAEQWASVRMEPQDFVVVGDDVVVVPVRFIGVGKQSGVETVAHPAHVWTFRAGRIIRQTTYQTMSEALGAVGLSEQDAQRSSPNPE